MDRGRGPREAIYLFRVDCYQGCRLWFHKHHTIHIYHSQKGAGVVGCTINTKNVYGMDIVYCMDHGPVICDGVLTSLQYCMATLKHIPDHTKPIATILQRI